ncbi:hypothetical protein [Flavobacterium magnesitis]|uniref:hypothetical protein n=1 Tax=Flavobacterium magnesitis TaxID=3138077 RepID=UPI00358F4CEE
MKQLLLIAFFFLSLNSFAQTPCEYATNITDSIGTYKLTKEYLISEKNFAGTSSYIFYTLSLTDGTPTLNVQLIQKSKGFIRAKCFDKNSKLYLQLNNGKVITLVHTNMEYCGSMIRDENGFDNRIIVGNFMFMKGTMEDLKNSPLSLMRIKYLTDIEDYVIKKELVSELNGKTYQPETFFIKNLECIEN